MDTQRLTKHEERQARDDVYLARTYPVHVDIDGDYPVCPCESHDDPEHDVYCQCCEV